MGADEQIWLSPRRKNPAASSCCATAAGCSLTARTDLEAFQQPFSSSAGGTVCLLCCRHVLRAELIHQIALFQPGKKKQQSPLWWKQPRAPHQRRGRGLRWAPATPARVTFTRVEFLNEGISGWRFLERKKQTLRGH